MLWRIIFVGIFSKNKYTPLQPSFMIINTNLLCLEDTHSPQETQAKFARSKATSSAAQRPTPPSTQPVIKSCLLYTSDAADE